MLGCNSKEDHSVDNSGGSLTQPCKHDYTTDDFEHAALAVSCAPPVTLADRFASAMCAAGHSWQQDCVARSHGSYQGRF